MSINSFIILNVSCVLLLIIIVLFFNIKKLNYLKSLKVKDLKIKSEVYLNDFNNLVINIMKLEPNNKNIKKFNDAYIDIVNKYNILKNISTNIKKANDINNIITLTYTDYYNEMVSVIKIYDDFNEIKNYYTNNSVKNTINSILKNINDFKTINDKSKYKIDFDLNVINEFFDDALMINSKIIDVLDIKYIDDLRQYYKQVVDLLNKSQYKLNEQKKLLTSYHNAENFIRKNVKDIPELINYAHSVSCDIYVPSYIKIRKYDIIKYAKSYIPDYSKQNILSSKNKLKNIIDNFDDYYSQCKYYSRSNKREKRKKKN